MAVCSTRVPRVVSGVTPETVCGHSLPLFIPTSEVETADDADDADKQELGGETSRMSPKNAPQTKPVYHP